VASPIKSLSVLHQPRQLLSVSCAGRLMEVEIICSSTSSFSSLEDKLELMQCFVFCALPRLVVVGGSWEMGIGRDIDMLDKVLS